MVIYALISLCTPYSNVDYCFVSCFGVSALSLFKKRLCLVCLTIYNRIAQSAYWNIRWNALLYSKLYIENNCEKRRLLRKRFPYIFTFLLSFLILALSCIIFLMYQSFTPILHEELHCPNWIVPHAFKPYSLCFWAMSTFLQLLLLSTVIKTLSSFFMIVLVAAKYTRALWYHSSHHICPPTIFPE